MPTKFLRRLLITGGMIVAAIIVVLVLVGVVVEATFRPKEKAAIANPSDLGYIQGRVSESTGWIPLVLPGIEDAEVSLTPGGQKTTTDDDGFFAVPEIMPGVYTVTIAAAGFETARIRNVLIGGGRITTLPDEALFAEIQGPPKAHIKAARPMPFGTPRESYPYLTAVQLDATDSENISRQGIRFEIRDDEGLLLMDPSADKDEPLQPERSRLPGASPALFVFTPPRPGDPNG